MTLSKHEKSHHCYSSLGKSLQLRYWVLGAKNGQGTQDCLTANFSSVIPQLEVSFSLPEASWRSAHGYLKAHPSALLEEEGEAGTSLSESQLLQLCLSDLPQVTRAVTREIMLPLPLSRTGLLYCLPLQPCRLLVFKKHPGLPGQGQWFEIQQLVLYILLCRQVPFILGSVLSLNSYNCPINLDSSSSPWPPSLAYITLMAPKLVSLPPFWSLLQFIPTLCQKESW